MKVLVYKHCGNIRFGDRKESNGGNTEIHVVIDNLRKAGHEVGVMSIDRYEEESKGLVDRYFLWDHMITAITWADVHLCFNGVFNAFGGQVSEEAFFSYRMLNMTSKPLIYAVTDTAIPIGDMGGWIRNAQGKGAYCGVSPEAHDFDPKRIYCLTQVYDLEKMKKLWKPEQNAFGAYGHFPFEMTVLSRKGLQININENPTTDLLYFGNARGGKRDKKFIKYYCNQKDLKVDVYGNGWKPEKFPAGPDFLGKLDMYELHYKINASLAHCYISDPKNEGTIWTTRFYEAIMNRTVLFIDEANDIDHQRFKNPFFYVSSAEELRHKVLMLKNDPHCRKAMLDEQFMDMHNHLKVALDFPRVLSFYLNAAKDHHATYLQGLQR